MYAKNDKLIKILPLIIQQKLLFKTHSVIQPCRICIFWLLNEHHKLLDVT